MTAILEPHIRSGYCLVYIMISSILASLSVPLALHDVRLVGQLAFVKKQARDEHHW